MVLKHSHMSLDRDISASSRPQPQRLQRVNSRGISLITAGQRPEPGSFVRTAPTHKVQAVSRHAMQAPAVSDRRGLLAFDLGRTRRHFIAVCLINTTWPQSHLSFRSRRDCS